MENEEAIRSARANKELMEPKLKDLKEQIVKQENELKQVHSQLEGAKELETELGMELTKLQQRQKDENHRQGYKEIFR